VPLDPDLVTVLACPIDHGALHVLDDENLIYNPRLRRKYAIREGIAVMLIDESTEADDAEHRRLQARIDAGESRVTGS